MHTRTIRGATFVYNSDLSGRVEVIDAEGKRASVPGAALVTFMAHFVRTERISALEQLSERAVLGLEDLVRP